MKATSLLVCLFIFIARQKINIHTSVLIWNLGVCRQRILHGRNQRSFPKLFCSQVEHSSIVTSFPRADSVKRGEPQSNFAALGELDQQWPDNQDQCLHGYATVTEGHRGDVMSTALLPVAFPIKRESSGLKCEESTQPVSTEGGHNVVDQQT